MRKMQWEVKVSKLCNLRCQYCYEFAELDDRTRIGLNGWRAIFESARWYQEKLERQNPGEFVYTEFVWHGGEPLLLPLAYYEDVLALQREILGADNINRIYSNHVPTNLFTLPSRTIDLLRRERFQIALSFDGVGGMRRDLAGRDTEKRVAQNMRRLLAEGWKLGCNTVVASHNVSHLQDVYDTVRDWVYEAGGHVYLNFIPLHTTPTEGPSSTFSLSAERSVEAMFGLFKQWLDDPRPVPLFPMQSYYPNVVRKLIGMPREYFDRRVYGESTLVVNTDGYLYVFNDVYDRERSMGCLFEVPFKELMKTAAYERSLRRYEALVKRYCHGCPYDGYCNRETMISGHREHPGERCEIAYPLHRLIEEHLVSRGFTPEELERRLPELPRLEFVVE